MDRSDGTVSGFGIAAAVIPWIVTLVLALLFMIDGLGRFVVQRPFPFEVIDVALRIAGGLLIVAICIGVVDFLAALFDGRPATGDDPRTRLAYWPGLGLAFAGAVVATALTATLLRGGIGALALPLAALGDHVSGALLVSVAVPALIAPARLRGALTLMALPLTGLVMLGMTWEVSIAVVSLELAVVLLPICILLLVVGLATGVAQLAWGGAAGLFLLVLLGPILLGLMTPTEALAVVALFAIPTGFAIQASVARGDMKQALVDGGREMAAVVAILLMSVMMSRLLALLGWSEAWAAAALNVPWLLASVLLVVIVAALGYVATPMLAIGLCAVLFGPAVRLGGFDTSKAAVLIVVAGLVAAILRVVPATAGSERRLSLPVAAATVAGVLAMSMALLALVRLPALF